MGIQGKTYSYEYDVNGLRTRKTNSDGGYTEYFIMDGLTVAERKFNASNTEVYTMRYYFDDNNAPVGIGIQYPSQADTYWANYYFAKNLQGDIIAVYTNNNGTPNLIATYEYDSWGKPLGIYNASGTAISQTSSSIAALNPFRYRGYRYDADTGFYYLQSRYYDPTIGRFINADGYASTGQGFLGCNMFAYCRNNPVTRKDASGTEDVCVGDFNEDDNTLNDLGSPTGVGSGGGGSMGGYTATAGKPFLPDSFYSKHAPKQSTPYSSYTNYTYNDYTGSYEKSTAYYDFAGWQVIRIDWTNHGYSDHGNPHVHYITYNAQYRDGFSVRWDLR